MNKSLTLSLALCTSLIYAQTPDSLIVDLAAIVVAADYEAQENSPLTFLNLPKQEIERQYYGQEPAFLLTSTPSMTAYSDAGNAQGYAYFRLRGIDQTRLSITLDGVPLNEPEDQGIYFSNYPDFFNSISRIQIQRGVGSTLNGNPSFGGSIQLTSPLLHQPQALEAGLTYGSFNTQRAHVEYRSGVRQRTGIYLRGSHVHSDGYKDHSDHTGQSIFYSLGHFGDKHLLKLVGFIGQQRNQMAWLGVSDSILQINPRANANTKAEDDLFTQGLVQLQHQWSFSPNTSLRSSIFYNSLDGNYDFDLNNFLGFASSEALYNYAFRSHFGGLFSNLTHHWQHGKLTLGVNAHRYQRRHIGAERTVGQLYSNIGFRSHLSAFAKIEQQYNRWSILADIQYRYSDFNYQGTVQMNELSWNFFNPKGGIQYQLSPHTAIYYSVGQNGREPTRNDIFGGSDDLLADSSGQALLFLTKPEQVIDQELGVRWENTRTTVHFNAYYMNFTNEIILNGQFGPNGLALNNGVDQSYRTGLELEATHTLNDQLSFRGNIALNYAQIHTEGIRFEPILSPRWLLNKTTTFTHHNWLLALQLRYQDVAYIDFANENTIPSFVLVNLHTHYNWKKWQFGLFLQNLTNTQAYTQGYVDFDGSNKYFIQASRHFFVQLKRQLL